MEGISCCMPRRAAPPAPPARLRRGLPADSHPSSLPHLGRTIDCLCCTRAQAGPAAAALPV